MNEREPDIAKAVALLDALIEDDPDRAERFIEARLARLALRKRLTDRKAALASERAKQAEPVATVVGTSDLEGRVQWRQSQRVELGTKLYTSPPAVQVDSEFCNKCGRIHNLPIEVLARSSADDVAWGIDWGRNGDQTAVPIIKKLPDGSIEVVATEYGPPADDEAECERLREDLRGLEEVRREQAAGRDYWSAECERLRKDAERYRWLVDYGPVLFVNHEWIDGPLDAAIDAAIKEQP